MRINYYAHISKCNSQSRALKMQEKTIKIRR